MSKIYDPNTIEEKWLAKWEKRTLFYQTEKPENLSPEDKMYLLFAFAYPSGSGLHVGHVESKTALDILARFYRMHGKQVFFPVGWDAFGLPAENYAVKTGVHPEETTKKAINTFRRQIKRVGISYDWANEIATCHPGYYKWTQWIFTELFKAGLAYQKEGAVNWCPSCQTVLANEQVVNGHCERCDHEVVQKEMKQWYFRITDYKDELIDGLQDVDWPEATKQQQLNWIGRSKGLSIEFTHQPSSRVMPVWTKFWETIFGVTFVVISPEKFQEYGLDEYLDSDKKSAVQKYIKQALNKTQEERQIGSKDKTGVDTGMSLTNPVNGQEIPLLVADYVLAGVGTGVVMGVPSHDQRDFEFAQKFKLPMVQVVEYQDKKLNSAVAAGEISAEGPGKLINSGEFNGKDAWGEGKTAMADWMIGSGFAGWETTYRLRDWTISRQRYWGSPIPVVYDPDGNAHVIELDGLPWELPTDVDFKPTGESPLVSSKEFQSRTQKYVTQNFADLIAENGWKQDGSDWRPEYDTMDTFVDSSWYFMRYPDSRNTEEFASKEQLQSWLPVDFYMIGPEHIVLHLLYSRFFTKFLRDRGYLKFDEPFVKMRHQGMILGPDGKKMSKSKGNVINPDDVIEKFGADTLRVYEMFMGPIDADKPWDVSAVSGVYRFLSRVNQLVTEWVENDKNREKTSETTPSEDTASQLRRKIHQTILKVSTDIPEMKFNTATAAMMECVNLWQKQPADPILREDVVAFVKILAPLAPFLAEELFALLELDEDSVHLSSWPTWSAKLAKDQFVIIPIQVNGKVRDQLELENDNLNNKDDILNLAKNTQKMVEWLEGKKIVKEIYVPGKIVNFVVRD